MRFLVQRVTEASVTVKGEKVGQIGKGYLVLIGVGQGDSQEDADKLIKKLINLRIFADEAGKINLSIKDVEGKLLLVSQFTLYADVRHGNRPGFTLAGDPEAANELYRYIIERCRKEVPVECGIFGENMQVFLVNDGPFTVLLDSNEL